MDLALALHHAAALEIERETFECERLGSTFASGQSSATRIVTGRD
jgi:hypothetical protein